MKNIFKSNQLYVLIPPLYGVSDPSIYFVLLIHQIPWCYVKGGCRLPAYDWWRGQFPDPRESTSPRAIHTRYKVMAPGNTHSL